MVPSLLLVVLITGEGRADQYLVLHLDYTVPFGEMPFPYLCEGATPITPRFPAI